MTASLVYLIRMCSPVGEIKIGTTADLTSRLTALRTGSPYALEVLATRLGGVREEAELHRRFDHLRLQGEWFRPGTDLLDYLGDLPDTLPKIIGPLPRTLRNLEAAARARQKISASSRAHWAFVQQERGKGRTR